MIGASFWSGYLRKISSEIKFKQLQIIELRHRVKKKWGVGERLSTFKLLCIYYFWILYCFVRSILNFILFIYENLLNVLQLICMPCMYTYFWICMYRCVCVVSRIGNKSEPNIRVCSLYVKSTFSFISYSGYNQIRGVFIAFVIDYNRQGCIYVICIWMCRKKRNIMNLFGSRILHSTTSTNNLAFVYYYKRRSKIKSQNGSFLVFAKY